jgi:four helix bundle protein
MTVFDHEKLHVYQAAEDFVAFAEEVIERFPKGRAYLADQLHRAATSIALNIAEGAGEFRAGDKARFYRMALRSATECAALLGVSKRLGFIDESVFGPGHDLLGRIAAMLTRMAKRFDGAGSETGSGSGTGSGSETGTGTGSDR